MIGFIKRLLDRRRENKMRVAFEAFHRRYPTKIPKEEAWELYQFLERTGKIKVQYLLAKGFFDNQETRQ